MWMWLSLSVACEYLSLNISESWITLSLWQVVVMEHTHITVTSSSWWSWNLEHSSASSAFLASAAASSDLVQHILPMHLQLLLMPNLEYTLSQWSQGHDNPPSTVTLACIQKTWDAYKVSYAADLLLENWPWWYDSSLASCSSHFLLDNTIRVTVSLRLRSTLCCLQTCQHYEAEVYHLAIYIYVPMDSAAGGVRDITSAI